METKSVCNTLFLFLLIISFPVLSNATISQQKIIPVGDSPYSGFGQSVSVSGNYLIFGADESSIYKNGCAYIFYRDGNSFVQQARIVAADGALYDFFGSEVAISSNDALVGAPGNDAAGRDAGAVYIFNRDGEIWTQQHLLFPTGDCESTWFGSAVALSGEYAIVGAPTNSYRPGEAYIFKKDSGTWTLQQKLTADDGFEGNEFGQTVSISGDFAIIGAWGKDHDYNWSGAAYIFKKQDNTWIQQAKLISDHKYYLDYFGKHVSISGDFAVVGADNDNEIESGAGAVYVFKREEDRWIHHTKLTPDDKLHLDHFGISVSIDNDSLLIGTRDYLDYENNDNAVHLYKRYGDDWRPVVKLYAQDIEKDDKFGFSIDVKDNFAAVGSQASYAYLFGNLPGPKFVTYENFDHPEAEFTFGTSTASFSVADGRLAFKGSQDETDWSAVNWNGGANPGGDFPRPGHSNYFDNFIVSVDTTWEARAENYGYGLITCVSKSNPDTLSYMSFYIDQWGSYYIGKKTNGAYETVADWTKCSLIATDGTDNNLAVKKIGPYFYFYINRIEVYRQIIEGFHGGGVGVMAFHPVDAGFDNFTISRLSPADLPDEDNAVQEDFSIGTGGFPETTYFSLSDKHMSFHGNPEYTGWHATLWDGGYHPGGIFPQPEHTNFFEDFHVSVDTYWAGRARDGYYGLLVCLHKNTAGSDDYLSFDIYSDGRCSIFLLQNGEGTWLMEPFQMSCINTGTEKNTLEITRNGSEFCFYINERMVQTKIIEGVFGGSIGIESSHYVDADFDNFAIIRPGTRPIADTGADQTVAEGDTVGLDGSNSSDPDESIHAYEWFQLSGPSVVLQTPFSARSTFTAPEAGLETETLIFQLRATDTSHLVSTDLCQVAVNSVDAPGDIDHDGYVTIGDAIIVLKALSGSHPAGIRTDYRSSVADVDGNSHLGMSEAIYILWKIAYNN